MSFFRKWVSPAPQKTPEFNEKRSPTPTPLSGPEGGLAILPNELIPTVLARLDSRSLFCVAQVSRRFNELSTRDWLARHGITPSQLSSGHVTINSDRPVEAFAALRIALFLRVRPFTGLTVIIPFVPDSQVISQLNSLISWFTPRLATPS
ncbi:hypothetical protein B0H14DRAFT_3464813 [Mycena olivaceomarginata]|nr:hypothetical protein B0H14DRAFT_3464813 [Mycena olivaceomarginata]